jgi:hypothetical protein
LPKNKHDNKPPAGAVTTKAIKLTDLGFCEQLVPYPQYSISREKIKTQATNVQIKRKMLSS